jgi:hypothetical protein
MIVGGKYSATAMLGGELTMNAMLDCFEAASADAIPFSVKKVTSGQVFRWRVSTRRQE